LNVTVTARYLYMNAEGNIHGPFWLFQMGDLWKSGRINLRTEVCMEVCMEGTRRWELVEFHPKIFEQDARLPVFAKLRRTKSDLVRLTLWMIGLGLALVIWLMRYWASR
jgi:hypothetical protein